MNAAPVLAAIGDKTVEEGTLLTFVISAEDPNDLPPNTLTLTADGLPDGASFDAATGVFTWTPSEAQGPGSHEVTFVATDDGLPPLSASETITITVTTASQPLRIDMSSVRVESGRVGFSWPVGPGKSYRVQHKASLSDAEWLDSPNTPVLNAPTASFTDDLQGVSRRYYRVVEND